jgi:integrase
LPFQDVTYCLYSEKIPSGEKYFRAYLDLIDPLSGRKKKHWTGIKDTGTKRAEAEAHQVVRGWIANQSYPGTNKSQPHPTVSAVLTPFGSTVAQMWPDPWDWERCSYLRKLLTLDPKAIGQETAANRRSLYLKHILPYFGEIPIKAITTADLEDFVQHLLGDRGLTTQTAKHAIQTIRPIFEQAVKSRTIDFNPILAMTKIKIRIVKPKDVFTLEETQKLLRWEHLRETWIPVPDSGSKRRGTLRFQPWFDVHRGYAIALLVALTSVRVGTMLALRREDIAPKYRGTERFYAVSLEKRVTRITGPKDGTKTDKGTEVPIAVELLDPVLRFLPKTGPLFPSNRGRTGILDQSSARHLLFKALEKIGIPREVQKTRNLGFHSFRHTWVTQATASGVSDEVQSGFTEHKDARTRIRYEHLEAGDKLSALAVQRKIIAGPMGDGEIV